MSRFFARLLASLLVAGSLCCAALCAQAQTCDYKVVSARWSPHPDPDSIYVHFSLDIDGPVSADSLNPSVYDMDVYVKFNGAPLEPPHMVHLVWWQKNDVCTPSCPPLTCLYKSWMFKGVFWTDHTVCTLLPQGGCGCPSIGTPEAPPKAVAKPPGPGVIEIEIIALSLVSCPPVNPTNDRKQFPYPGGGASGVPGWPANLAAGLIAALLVAGAIAMRRQSGPRNA